MHAWHGYCLFAWGADELRPDSKRGHNSYGSVSITILDSLTTLWLLDVPDEFERTALFVEDELRFGVEDRALSVFELTIRALGGLLGAHALSGRPGFLRRAAELAERLLPAFNTSSGLPWPHWSLAPGGGPPPSPSVFLADAGSLQLEWRYLSQCTGDRRFGDAADAAFAAIQASGLQGLLPVHLTPPERIPPRPVRSDFAVGGRGDSYYEYLLKQWLLGPAEDKKPFRQLFLSFMEELPELLRPTPSPTATHHRSRGRRYRIISLDALGRPVWKMEHLSCFVPGVIALAILTLPPEDVAPRRAFWMDMADGITAACVEMWGSTATGLAPEHVVISPRSPYQIEGVPEDGKHSLLRPETVESLFYMYQLTRDAKYRQWGEQIFRAILAQGKAAAGFSSVADVRRTPAKTTDETHSFVLAETFKYLYLLFAPPGLLDLRAYVLNTEGHPLRRALRGPCGA